MRRNVYSSAVFTGGRPLCTQILPGQGNPPPTILGIKQTRDTGLTDGEDRIPLRSLILTKIYRSVTDRQTDGRICRSIYCGYKISFAAHCKSRPIFIVCV